MREREKERKRGSEGRQDPVPNEEVGHSRRTLERWTNTQQTQGESHRETEDRAKRLRERDPEREREREGGRESPRERGTENEPIGECDRAADCFPPSSGQV